MSDERFLGMTKGQFGIALFVVNLVLVLVAVGTLTYAVSASRSRDAQVAALAAQSQASWCAAKQNAQTSIGQTIEYLATHPGPEPIPGITRATLLDGLKRQRAFVAAIKVEGCQP